MNQQSRRKELKTQYKESTPEAGVYRIVNIVNHKALLGSTLNLAGMRSKMDFAKSTGSTGVFDYRLRDDIRKHGIVAFELEVLETLDIRPEMTDAEIRADLAALETLWREQLDAASLY